METGSEVLSAVVDDVAEVVEEYFGVKPLVVLLVEEVSSEVVSAIV